MAETVRLSQPVDYIAIVPYLFGFHPTMSLVILGFRDQTLINGIRHDLPHNRDEIPNIVAHSLDILTREEASGIWVIGYGPASLVTPVLDDMRAAIAPTGIHLAEFLRCEDSHYWFYPDLGPPDGTPYDITTSQAAAGAVVAGLAASPDRETFAACLQPAQGPDRDAVRAATHVARERATSMLTTATPRDWYEEGLRCVHAAFARQLAGEPTSPEELTWLGILLTSITVRDVAITLIGTYSAPAHIALWSEVVRRVETGYAAAPATLLGVAAFGTGAGTLARIAIDRALADNPAYSMARLVDFALSNGVPPSAIHEMHATVTTEEIEAQVKRCPRAALPQLPTPGEGR
ncbi:DUF4192 domain-containing protein [Nonomuraea sp. KM90]|uniref:DUF4192 domain-containing protein n=1 Tax=Nonomuraea sp. KM90 TaxID=3457428 RepID=UPI003FCCB449